MCERTLQAELRRLLQNSGQSNPNDLHMQKQRQHIAMQQCATKIHNINHVRSSRVGCTLDLLVEIKKKTHKKKRQREIFYPHLKSSFNYQNLLLTNGFIINFIETFWWIQNDLPFFSSSSSSSFYFCLNVLLCF